MVAGECVAGCPNQTDVHEKCPRCRCIEEMQIITLSGYQAYWAPERPVISALGAAAPLFSADVTVDGKLANQPIPHMLSLLSADTCVLRF